MKILVIDNYDSFTYNVVHLLKEIVPSASIDVFRNDKIDLGAIKDYDKIVISPGPGIPDEAGITKEVIRIYGSSKSILGICLGCQSIAEVYGGSIENLTEVFHGVSTDVMVTDKSDVVMSNIPSPFTAGRYHSWVVSRDSLPSCLRISSEDEEGKIMSIYHTSHDVRGVQFHPESIMTDQGRAMITNWINA